MTESLCCNPTSEEKDRFNKVFAKAFKDALPEEPPFFSFMVHYFGFTDLSPIPDPNPLSLPRVVEHINQAIEELVQVGVEAMEREKSEKLNQGRII